MGPRVGLAAVARQIGGLPHRLPAYRGADGLPVIVPVAVPGHDAARLRLDVAPGLLPPGGRRAGFLAQAFRPQRVRLGMRTLTGRLTVTDEDSRYAPHTSTGLAAPPYKTFLTASKRLLAQYELRRTRRDGTAARAQALAAHSPMD